MNTLTEWVRNLVVLVFVLSAAQLLLPTNNMRPYVRFVLGLVVISALLTSLFNFTSLDTGLGALLFPERSTESALPYIEQGRALATAAQARLLQQDNERARLHVTSIATIVLGVEPEHVAIEWSADGGVRHVTITTRHPVGASGTGDYGGASAFADDVGTAQGNGPADGSGVASDVRQAARVIAGFLGLEQRQVEIGSGPHRRGGSLR